MSHSFDSFSSEHKPKEADPDPVIEPENAFNKISSKKNTSSEKGDETDKQQVSINL